MYCQSLFSYFSFMSMTLANISSIVVCVLSTSRCEASLHHFYSEQDQSSCIVRPKKNPDKIILNFVNVNVIIALSW